MAILEFSVNDLDFDTEDLQQIFDSNKWEFRDMVFEEITASDIVEIYESDLSEIVREIPPMKLMLAMTEGQREQYVNDEISALRKENEQLKARNKSLKQAIKGLNDVLNRQDPMSETDSEGCPLKHP